MKTENHENRMHPAQQDSGMSILKTSPYRPYGPYRPYSPLDFKTGPAQRDSGIYILKTSPYRPLAVRLVPLCGDPYRPLDFKTSPAQRDSKMSNSGACPTSPTCQTAPKRKTLKSHKN